MDLDELIGILDGAKRSAFRLEQLPQYLVPEEEEEFAAWRAGQPWVPRTVETSAWLAELQGIVAGGVRWYRVHILDFPLADYSRYELRAYQDSQAAGEEINVVDRAAHPELADLCEDFWLVDDEIAVRMVYDAEGHFLRPEAVDDVAPYRRMRETAMRHSAPLDDFLASRKPKLTM